jgi:transcriptional regulator with GAF, ATPase, and Fis domain
VQVNLTPEIIALSGPSKGSVFPITDAKLTIGRAADNTVSLPDELVSGHHLAIWLHEGRAYLKDGDTPNGTWINGVARSDRFLEHGDRIKCGSTTFLYRERADASEDLPAIIDNEADRNRQLETLRADYSSRGDAAVYYRGVIKALGKLPAYTNAITDIHELQVCALDLGFEIIPAYKGAILLNGPRVSPDPADFVSQIYRERDFDGDARFPLSSRVLIDAYKSRTPLMSNNITPVLCVPLFINGAMGGVVYMEGRDGKNGFDPEHLQYLTIIGENIVNGLRKGRQIESVQNERDVLKETVQTDTAMIGESDSMKAVRKAINLAASSGAPVLITGETGTGKELVARLIHELSSRAKVLFVAVNCPAVVESLFESEFFGHVKGAFTGATEARPGKFKQADGGTLFLDEIGELKLHMQPKLLRVLQEQEFEPVGGNRKTKVNVRVIAATNVDLEKAVRENTFRADLFYRLNSTTIHLPPLRERSEDIPLLANHFVEKYRGKAQDMRIAPEALEAIMSYDWPGNVRELEGVIRPAVDMARATGVDTILVEDLPGRLTEPRAAAAAVSDTPTLKNVTKAGMQARAAAARQTMQETGNNAKEAARRLGISEGYLYRLLRIGK